MSDDRIARLENRSLAPDECAFCHRKGHWRYHCPKKGCLPSSQQFQTHFRAPPPRIFQHSAAYTAFSQTLGPDLASLSAQIGQLQHILFTFQPSPSVSVVSSLHSSLFGSLQRREQKSFLKEKEAKLQRGKAMFLGKLRASKVISSVRSWDDQEKILKVISAQLEREMEFKEQNGLIFEEEDAFTSLHEQDHICKSSEHQTQLHGATLAEPPPPAWFTMGAQKPLPWQNSQLP